MMIDFESLLNLAKVQNLRKVFILRRSTTLHIDLLSYFIGLFHVITPRL